MLWSTNKTSSPGSIFSFSRAFILFFESRVQSCRTGHSVSCCFISLVTKSSLQYLSASHSSSSSSPQPEDSRHSNDATTEISRDLARFPSQKCGGVVCVCATETRKDGDAGERSSQSYREQRRGKMNDTLTALCTFLVQSEGVVFCLFERWVRARKRLNVLPIVTRAPVTLSVPVGFKTTPSCR